MKVYLGKKCHYNGYETWIEIVKVFDDKFKALAWKKEVPKTKYEWRSYEEMEVE
jgi:hypothetical protein